MHRDMSRYKVLTRRALMLGAVQAGVYALLVGRLYYLQVFKAAEYKKLSDENRISLRVMPPSRGKIYDRVGKILVDNRESFDVVFIPEKSKDDDKTLSKLQEILLFPQEHLGELQKQINRNYAFRPITIAENIDWSSLAKIQLNLPYLPGVMVNTGQIRNYPLAEKSSGIFGYVGAPSKKEYEKYSVMRIPGFKTGKNGLELVYEDDMRGYSGLKELEVNAKGRTVRELGIKAPTPGHPLKTTLNYDLQSFMYERMSEHKSGSVVALDIKTGGVLGMASVPSYDPNKIVSGMSADYWRGLQTDPLKPMTNRAIAGQYPPGSTFKMIVALAALEAGVINSSTSFFCPGYLYLGGHKFHCWKEHGHGSVSLSPAIAYSCDVYFYQIARKVGVDKIAETAKKFGLGVINDLDLPGEKSALMPNRAWKKRVLGQSWYPGDSFNAGIGQGYVLTTPLQLALMTARLASGKQLVPTLNADLIDNRLKNMQNIEVDPHHLRLIKNAMARTSNEPGATGYRYRLTDKQFKMAGKSGTAQVKRITQRERDLGQTRPEHRPWKWREHALFVGYAPIENPKYAVASVVVHGGWGGKISGPIVRDTLQKCLDLEI